MKSSGVALDPKEQARQSADLAKARSTCSGQQRSSQLLPIFNALQLRMRVDQFLPIERYRHFAIKLHSWIIWSIALFPFGQCLFFQYSLSTCLPVSC